MAERASARQRRRHLLGLRARARRRDAREWVQVNCGLFPQAASQGAFVPWAELAEKLEAWRTEKRLDQCFFMRKSPGLRLRFAGPDLIGRLEPILVDWLEAAEQRNLIRSFRFATYEPEVFRFGGPVGMDIAHDQFDRDSRLVIRYEALREAGTVDLPREQLSLALVHDLFVRFAEDRSELWDIWQRVWHAHGCPQLPPAEEITVPALQSLVGAAASLGQAGLANNAHIASRVRAADTARRLECGPRAWLTEVCTFHWNRLGLSLQHRTPLMSAMLQLLDPHRADG
jgi:thiopeptide-type bacteriocin biosynthesis protein